MGAGAIGPYRPLRQTPAPAICGVDTGPPHESDYRFYISSLVRSATAFVSMIRQHWDIENKLHWSLDVTFNEDRSRIRKEHAAENMAAVRHVALNLLRQEHSHQISLRQKRLLCGLDENYLLMVLSRAT